MSTSNHEILFRLSVLLLLANGYAANALSQSSHFTNYSVEDGLQFVFVGALYQDANGYLWAGGYGGLSRFDGHTFTHYGARQNLVNHDVQAITGTDDGEMWIATLGGLSRLKNNSMRNFKTKDGLLNNAVNAVLTSANGTVWVGTDGGLNAIVHDSLFEPAFNRRFPEEKVQALCEDHKGNILIGTDHGLAVLNSGTEKTTQPMVFPGKNITALFVDKDGILWVGTSKGLYRTPFDPDSLEHIQTDGAVSPCKDRRISAVVQGPAGDIWIGTETGLIKFDGKSYCEYPVSESANGNIVGSLYFDAEGNLWIGTYAGLYKYRGDSFINYSIKDGLSGNFIFPILRDSRNDLWIGTNNNGLNRYDGRTFEVFTETEGLPDNSINAALEDRLGNIWIGTDSGLCKIMVDPISRKPVFTSFTNKHGLVSDMICSILEDEKGRLYFGGAGGITRFADNRFESFYFTGPYQKAEVWSMVKTRDNKLWLGTYKGGLFSFDGKEFSRENERLGLRPDVCLTLVEDNRSNLWIGTFEGVFMYNGSTLVPFDEAHGLTSNLIYSMTIDQNNEHLWIGTNQGLNKLNLQPYYETGRKVIEHYGKEEGFTGVECNTNGIFNEADGSIWFGTVEGLSHFVPSAYYPNEREAKTNILHTRIFYQDTTLPDQARLAYDQNHISFDYVGVCLTNPSKVSYQYRLLGYDKTWSPVSQNRTATYSSLPSGRYTFQVRSCNNEFKWNKEPAAFSFSISTPYWETWWFRTMTIMTIAGAVFLGFYLRIKRINQANALSRRMDSLKLEALRSQMNPHFIFNSMNAIQHYINDNNKRLANDYLGKFAGLMRLILDHSQKETVSISDDARALELYVQLEQLRFENKFAFELSIAPDIDPDYLEIPPNLIQPFVENAIIHGLLNKKNPGKVTVAIKLERNHLLCTIEDDGIGREAAAAIRRRDNRSAGHQPLGMQITTDRISLISQLDKSELSVQISDLAGAGGKACGTRVVLKIPVATDE